MYIQITLYIFKNDTATHRLHRIHNSEYFIRKSCLQVDLNILLTLNWTEVQPEFHAQRLSDSY